MAFIVTGAAGFIGQAISKYLLQLGKHVIGIDNFESYYSTALKERRVSELRKFENFDLINKDVREVSKSELNKYEIETIIHMAAQPGVRIPANNYQKYIDNNLSAFLSICGLVKDTNTKKFIYASSSSVYGNDSVYPFTESKLNPVPSSFYGYSKLLDEIIAKDFFEKKNEISHLGLRFFTVYGEFGRPDMFYFRLAGHLLLGIPITLFGNGKVKRDFTYVGDVVKAISLILPNLEVICDETSVLNIGGGSPTTINEIITKLENIVGVKSNLEVGSQNINEMLATEADFKNLLKFTGFKPETNIDTGLKRFVDWLRNSESQKQIKEWLR